MDHRSPRPPRLPLGARLAIGTPAQLSGARTRSHLADARCVGLLGAVDLLDGWVVDAELDVRPPAALARRFGSSCFWERWTRAECAAKLAEVPMQRWLGRHGLDDPTSWGVGLGLGVGVGVGVDLDTGRIDRGTVVVTTGRPRPPAPLVRGASMTSAG